MSEGTNYAFGDYWSNRKVDTVEDKIAPNVYTYDPDASTWGEWSMSPGGSQAGAIASFKLDLTSPRSVPAGDYVYPRLLDNFSNPAVARWVPVGPEANQGYHGIEFGEAGLYAVTIYASAGCTASQGAMVTEKMIYATFDGYPTNEGTPPYAVSYGIDTPWLDDNEVLFLTSTGVMVEGPGDRGVQSKHRMRPLVFAASNPWEFTIFDVMIARLA